MEIWEPKPPGTLWTTPGLLRDSFTFFLLHNMVLEKVELKLKGHLPYMRQDQGTIT